jgi:hypothetical protein
MKLHVNYPKFVRMKCTLISLCIGSLLFTGCEVPQRQKVADCTTSNLDFSMTVDYSPAYHFVLGVPKSETGKLSFRGEMVLRQTTGVVARIPINSGDVESCNWLHSRPDLSGYVLAWSRTNHGERFSDLLVQRQTYEAHVAFEEPPPVTSSLWFSSLKY